MKQQLKSRALVVASVAAVVGLMLAPVAASAVAQNTTVTAVVQGSIAIAQSGNVSFNVTPVSGGSQSSGNHTVTVTTNNALGYTLNLKDLDATLTLDGPSANTIAASSNTMAAATTLANNTWGWAIPSGTTGAATNTFDASYTNFTDQTSSATKWAGILATDQLIKSTSGPAGSGDPLVVNYSAKVDPTKAVGSYTDTVVYTATVK